MSEFSELSRCLTASLTKEEKKNGGIFFTPPKCIQQILALLRTIPQVYENIKTILEPSCGSGEFISALLPEFPNAKITGIELHPEIYKAVSKKYEGDGNRVTIRRGDFLKYDANGHGESSLSSSSPPDLIIGNPPYFVMKKEAVAAEYYPYFDGRPNIFILFIMKSAKILRPGGVMCFVLPSSFMNSQYYDKTRKYIAREFIIYHIARCLPDDKYIDTTQDTFVLIIEKRVPGSGGSKSGGSGGSGVSGVYEKSGVTIFTDHLPRMIRLYSGSRSLHELGFKVSVGTVVWNQCKDILTDDTSKTRLVYSSNIDNGSFVHKEYKNQEKKAFIDKPGTNEPMIVLNRGYGVGNYQFEYCLLTQDIVGGNRYLIENHLVCISASSSANVTQFECVIQSFRDPRTREFIACYFGNNAVNTTELNHMLPIYEI